MPQITLKQINHHKIQPVQIKTDPRPVKGAEIFPELYGNMFLIAHTNTGKTTILYNIIPKMIGKKTKIIVFAATAYSDDIWIALRKKLERMGNEVEIYTSIKDAEGNHLSNLTDQLTEEAKEREEQEEEEEVHVTPADILENLRKKQVDDYMDDPDERPKKERFRYPEYLIIFDDMSKELRNPDIAVLLKQCRHFHIRTIISSQYLKDLAPSSRQQIKGWCVFKGISERVIEELHESIGLKMPFEVFYELYKKSTADTASNKKNFFYFIPGKHDFRRNLNERWQIPPSLIEA
jgi:hypothetical protein